MSWPRWKGRNVGFFPKPPLVVGDIGRVSRCYSRNAVSGAERNHSGIDLVKAPGRFQDFPARGLDFCVFRTPGNGTPPVPPAIAPGVQNPDIGMNRLPLEVQGTGLGLVGNAWQRGRCACRSQALRAVTKDLRGSGLFSKNRSSFTSWRAENGGPAFDGRVD